MRSEGPAGDLAGSRERRAALWALALWLVAAAGLAGARTVTASGAWTPGTGTWGPRVASAAPGISAARSRRDPDGSSRRASEESFRRRERRGRREVRVARRQRLALAAGHSLPVPVEKAPRYRLDNRHHDYPALDLSLRYGTPVRAVTAGRVRKVTSHGACGRGVIVRGTDGLTYTYCHGKRVVVHKGERVPVGETIMKSGNTGNSSGPHLHLQVASRRGRLLCPQHMLRRWEHGKNIPTWKVGRHHCVR